MREINRMQPVGFASDRNGESGEPDEPSTKRCRFCESTGRVTRIARVRGGGVVACWHCRDCEQIWPVEHGEEQRERRSGAADRRRVTRADRRRHPE
jgi:hypothetical protein